MNVPDLNLVFIDLFLGLKESVRYLFLFLFP